MCAKPSPHKNKETLPENCRTQLELQTNANTPLPRATPLHLREKPILLPTLARVHLPPSLPSSSSSSPPLLPPPRCAKRDQAWHGSRGSRTNSRHNPGYLAQRRQRERPLLAWPWRFLVRQSLEDLHVQLRRFPRTIATELSVHPHAKAPTFDVDCDAPVVQDSVPHVDAHGSQARMHSTPLHLISALVLLVLELGVFSVKIVQRWVWSWQTRWQRDDQRIFRVPQCRWQPDTQMLLAAHLRPVTISCADSLCTPPVVRAYEGETPVWTCLGTARPCAG